MCASWHRFLRLNHFRDSHRRSFASTTVNSHRSARVWVSGFLREDAGIAGSHFNYTAKSQIIRMPSQEFGIARPTTLIKLAVSSQRELTRMAARMPRGTAIMAAMMTETTANPIDSSRRCTGDSDTGDDQLGWRLGVLRQARPCLRSRWLGRAHNLHRLRKRCV